jgi:hypothetical protein
MRGRGTGLDWNGNMTRLQPECHVRGSRAWGVLPLLALSLTLLPACERRPEPDEPAPDPAIPQTDASGPTGGDYPTPPPLPPESIPARPRTIQDTLLLEGMAEPSPATLVEAPAGFPRRFTTYLPEGLLVEFEGRGDSAGVRFHAAFAGTPDRNAYMHVRLYGTDLSRAQASQAATDFVRSRAPWRDEGTTAEPPPWGLEAYSFQYMGDGNVPYTGRVVLGHHVDRFFHVLTHYPAEYGDGLGPRFDRILQHWRWEDTGRLLVSR